MVSRPVPLHPGGLLTAAPPAGRLRMSGLEVPLVAGAALLAVYLALVNRALNPRAALLALTGILLAYIGTEFALFARRHRGQVPWLVSPIIIASLYPFAVSFGLTNGLYWLPGYRASFSGPREIDVFWLCVAMAHAGGGCVAMWVGFRSGIGTALGRALGRSRLLAHLLRRSYDLRWGVFWAFLGVSLVSRLIEVRLGVYGVTGDVEAAGAAAYRQYLKYAGNLGLIALIGVSLHTYTRSKPSVGARLTLVLILINEVAWGAVGMDKQNTVLPVVLVGLCYYLARRRLPIRYAALAVGVLALGFLVLMPLRKLAMSDEAFNTSSVTMIIRALSDVATMELVGETPQDDGPMNGLLVAMAARLNDTATAANAMRYVARGVSDPTEPAWLRNLLLSPVYAVVPRALWPSKPNVAASGTWYYRTVLGGRSATTQAGMSSVGYLYLAGGVIAVLAGFFVLGVLQRGAHERFLLAAGGGGAVVLLGLLNVLGDVPTLFGGIFAQMVRTLPLLIGVQYMLFRR